MSNKCTCSHLKDRHSFTGKGFQCNVSKCRCIEYTSISEEADHAETKREKIIRQNKRKGIVLREGKSSREVYDEHVFKADTIRNEYDITKISEDKLSWYQKVQKRRILEQKSEQ